MWEDNAHTLDTEDRWLERGVKEPIYIKHEIPASNRGGKMQISPIKHVQELLMILRSDCGVGDL